jgi:CheY-like chemotaxis protein
MTRPLAATILIVEPDAAARACYRAILDRAATVVESEDGVAALTQAFRTAPALLVANAQLPRVGGAALCMCLKAHPRTASVRTLILASDADEAHRAWAAGADAVLQKPFLDDALAAAVAQLWTTARSVGSTSNSIRPRSSGASGGSNSTRTTAPHV